jgi:hypothetical protein
MDEVRLYMFCLMTNHAHLLVETPRANLSQFMHRLETAYTVYFNLRHDRTGHLTERRYDAKLVEGEDYLLRLSRYLHQNPVSTKKLSKLPLKERTALLRRYPWSSYRSYVGLSEELEWVEYGPLREMVGSGRSRQRQRYRKFVESGLAETDEEFLAILKESPLSIGGEDFREKIRDMHADLLSKHARPEDVAFRKTGRPLKTEEVISEVCGLLGVGAEEVTRQRRDSLVRPLIAKMLCKYAGLSQRGVADRMGLASGAAVSQQLKRLEQAAGGSRELRRQIQVLDARLRSGMGH